MLTVRLDPETRKLLNRLAKEQGVSRSDIVRTGIRLVAEHHETSRESNPYERIRHLIGSARGGPPDLSERTGEKFREILSRKRRR